jgi:hypothetical protein
MTLLEVILALSITTVVLVGGTQALRTVTQFSTRFRNSNDGELRRRADENHLLELGRLAVVDDSTRFITGSSEAFGFVSTCIVQEGWRERCSVTIRANRAVSDASTSAFQVTAGSATGMTFGTGNGTLRYLADARNGGVWLSAWRDSVRLPLAVQLVSLADSLLIRLAPEVGK